MGPGSNAPWPLPNSREMARVIMVAGIGIAAAMGGGVI